MKLPYEVIRSATHEGWLEERKKGVGASAVGKLLGVSEYGTPLTLWRDILQLNPPIQESWPMRLGHALEPSIAAEFERTSGHKVIKNSAGDWLAVSRDNPVLRVSPDWLYWASDSRKLNDRGVLECKSSLADITIDNWRSVHADWFCQIQYQLHVLGLKEGYLGFINTKNGEMFFDKVYYNEQFCRDVIVKTIVEFWQQHILPVRNKIEFIQRKSNGRYSNDEIIASPKYYEYCYRFAPEATTGEDVTALFARQQDGKTIDADQELVSSIELYKSAKAKIKELEKQCHDFEDELKLKMLDAESISFEGKTLATFRANKSSFKFNDKRFQADHPDTYKDYLEERAGARILKIK